MGHTGHAEWLVGCSGWDSHGSGALVIGGDYRALGVVRSLGRHNIPVGVLTDDHSLAAVSRYARRRFRWPSADEQTQVEYLMSLNAEHGLLGWALFPSTDEAAATVARYHTTLRERFRLTTPPWDVLQWAYDKRLTYRLAANAGVPHPWTCSLACQEELAQLECPFPAVLKPAVKPSLNAFTIARAWRVDDRESLLTNWKQACALIDPRAIIIQELVPGGGEEQFSFAAVCMNGRALAHLVARRTRQYPIDFGRSSTFVETVDQSDIEEASRRLISEMGFTGMVEIEFKRDRRDGVYKLLDINPRIWGWHTLGRRAGVDFSHLLWRLIQGDSFSGIRGSTGVRWIRMLTDMAAAVGEIRRGRLTGRSYLRSLLAPAESAIFAADDPLPAVLELPLSACMVLKRGWI
jgi:D-aspartate ligase